MIVALLGDLPVSRKTGHNLHLDHLRFGVMHHNLPGRLALVPIDFPVIGLTAGGGDVKGLANGQRHVTTVRRMVDPIFSHELNPCLRIALIKPHNAAWQRLADAFETAAGRGVGIRFIAMGDIPRVSDIQVTHPDAEGLATRIGGESIDIIADKREALVGVFETGTPEQSPIIWTRNRSFVTTNRDSLQHDFYHYFLHRLYENGARLTDREKTVYEFIKNDD